MTKFKSVLLDGFFWLVAEANGKIHFLHKMGPVGNCQRWAGERMKGE